MVMEAADVGNLNNRAAGWRLCGPRHRRILVQGKMWAPLVIIGQEESERASKGLLIPHDDMIETLPVGYFYSCWPLFPVRWSCPSHRVRWYTAGRGLFR